MSEPYSLALPPKKILVASDLSGRSDRAVDRAVQLALTWGAELIAVHALESAPAWPEYGRTPSWRQPPDLAGRIERQLRDDLKEVTSADVRVLDGAAHEVIQKVAAQEHCDLVVLGDGRQRSLSGIGGTLDELFRTAFSSLLVVKQRPRRAYQRILIGTDFTDEALASLEVTARLFPQASLTLMHAFELPYRSLMSGDQLSRDFSAMEKETIRRFIERADIPQTAKDGIVPLVEHGPPAQMLHRYAAEHQSDVTVIGAYERGRIFHSLIGGQGPRILEAVQTDILVVRPQPPRT